MDAAWTAQAPKTALRGPSPEARKQLLPLPIDLRTGARVTNGNSKAFTEYFRLKPGGRLAETQYRFVSRYENCTLGDSGGEYERGTLPSYPDRGWRRDPDDGWRRDSRETSDRGPPRRQPDGFLSPPPFQSLFSSRQNDSYEDPEPARPRRIDPDYFWGQRRSY